MTDVVLTGSAVYKPVVLLAEDDPLLQNMYKTKFENEGFSVIVVSDGVLAVEQVQKKKPDCIVMDIMMPRMSGFDALEKIRLLPGANEIPVLMFTNLSTPETVARGVALGVQGFLIKTDVTPREVAIKVKEFITQKKVKSTA